MLLEHLGYGQAAAAVTTGVEETLVDGPTTPDLGGTATTAEVTDAIIGRL
jgi:3-isopropylmalate dehydrogenase